MKKLICLFLFTLSFSGYSQWIPPPLKVFERDYWVIPSDINSLKELGTNLHRPFSLLNMAEFIKLSQPITFPDDFRNKKVVELSFGYDDNKTSVSSLGEKRYVALIFLGNGNLNPSWSWTLTSNRSWIVLSNHSGSLVSYTTVNVEFKRNYSGSPRKGKINLNINGQTLELEIDQD